MYFIVLLRLLRLRAYDCESSALHRNVAAHHADVLVNPTRAAFLHHLLLCYALSGLGLINSEATPEFANSFRRVSLGHLRGFEIDCRLF